MKNKHKEKTKRGKKFYEIFVLLLQRALISKPKKMRNEIEIWKILETFFSSKQKNMKFLSVILFDFWILFYFFQNQKVMNSLRNTRLFEIIQLRCSSLLIITFRV
jgi:hypothetical protein